MVLGVAFFSYIINNFNDIMKNYSKKLGYIDKTPEVEEWLLSLSNNIFKFIHMNIKIEAKLLKISTLKVFCNKI